MQDIDWSDLKIVLAVYRCDSYAAAGRNLNINETTIARRIRRLETQLASRLFQRASGRNLPTAAGIRLAHSAERIEAEIEATKSEVSGVDQALAGSVRITAVPVLVNNVLIPAYSDFAERYPDLQLELIAESRDLSLTHRETDIALRLARPSGDSQMITRKITSLGYSVYARRGLDADALPWVSYEDGMRDLPQARWINSRREAGSICNVRPNDIQSVTECIKAGLGKSLLPDIVGAGISELVCVGNGKPVLSRELWIMVHPELRKLVRIHKVIEWLEGALTPN